MKSYLDRYEELKEEVRGSLVDEILKLDTTIIPDEDIQFKHPLNEGYILTRISRGGLKVCFEIELEGGMIVYPESFTFEQQIKILEFLTKEVSLKEMFNDDDVSVLDFYHKLKLKDLLKKCGGEVEERGEIMDYIKENLFTGFSFNTMIKTLETTDDLLFVKPHVDDEDLKPIKTKQELIDVLELSSSFLYLD